MIIDQQLTNIDYNYNCDLIDVCYGHDLQVYFLRSLNMILRFSMIYYDTKIIF